MVAFLRRSYSVSEEEDQIPLMHGYTTNVRDGDGGSYISYSLL